MEKLLVSPINEIREISQLEDVDLTASEIRLISKNYNSYWKEYEGAHEPKSIHRYFWEELERWGHPAAKRRNQAIEELVKTLKMLRRKYR